MLNNTIPENWKMKPLGEVADIISGQSPKSSSYNTDEQGLEFHQGKTHYGDKYLLHCHKYTNAPIRIVAKGTIVMSVRAPVGPVNIPQSKICIGRGLAGILPNKHLNKEFLYNFLSYSADNITGANGAIFDSINREQIKNIQIPIPPMCEQERIVGILDSVLADADSVIEKTEQSYQHTADLFQSILQQKLTNDTWDKKPLGELLSYEQPTPYIVKSTKYHNAYKTPVLTAGKGFIKGYTDETDSIYNKGDCIIFDDFTTATQFVNFDFKVKSSAMKILAPKYNDNAYFIYLSMQLLEIDKHSHKRWWISEYSKLEIPIPDIDEQNRIVSELAIIKTHITALQDIYTKKLAHLHDLKQSILQSAFRGAL